MSSRTPAEQLFRVNLVLLVVLSVLLVVCLVRQLWVPAAVFTLLIFSNAMQAFLRRKS